jgi:hypothetical protein
MAAAYWSKMQLGLLLWRQVQDGELRMLFKDIQDAVSSSHGGISSTCSAQNIAPHQKVLVSPTRPWTLLLVASSRCVEPDDPGSAFASAVAAAFPNKISISLGSHISSVVTYAQPPQQLRPPVLELLALAWLSDWDRACKRWYRRWTGWSSGISPARRLTQCSRAGRINAVFHPSIDPSIRARQSS